MKRKLLIFLPIVFSTLCLTSFPFKALAADWTMIAAQDKHVWSFVVDRSNNKKIVYNDRNQTYYTENGGSSWATISLPGVGVCNSFIQSNVNLSEYWAGCFPGLFHSIDGGKTFQKVNYLYFNSTEIRRVTQAKDGTLYVNAGVNYRSHDGIIWEALKGEGAPNSQIFPDPNIANTIYLSSVSAGTKGFYKSTDYGDNWQRLSSYYPLGWGVNSLIFNTDGSMCAAVSNAGYGCSANGGLNWSGFFNQSNSGVPWISGFMYNAVQNPDDQSNVIVYVGDSGGNYKKLYSVKSGQEDWSSTDLPMPLNSILISRGIIFGFSSLSGNGLWENADISVIPESLKKHPVIIVPGLLGSWEKNGQLVLDPLMSTYDNLYKSLQASGLEENKFLFVFPYDWRKDNNETARLLKQKIDEAKIASGQSKVDIIAHSMGGLVARAYAESDNYENDIDEIIFLGTPHLGSAKAYVPYESGDVKFGNDLIVGTYLDYVLNKEAENKGFNGGNKLYDYIRSSVPSVQQLLPIVPYLEDANTLRQYPNNYPSNSFLENLDKNKGLLKTRNIRTLDIVGLSTNKTVYKYNVTSSEKPPFWENGEPINYYSYFLAPYIYYTTGDDTVTSESATAVGDSVNTIDNVAHMDLPKSTDAIGIIEEQLSLDRKVNYGNINQGKGLLILVHSPIDLFFTNNEGKSVGKDPTSGLTVNEIENAYYYNKDGIEFAYLPNVGTGEYQITAKGTGMGEYEIEAHYIDEADNTDLKAIYSGQTGVDKITKVKLNIDSAKKNISVEPEDKYPPTTKMNITGKNNNGFYTADVVVSLEGSDDASGVKKTLYSFDKVNWTTYSGEVVLTNEGKNTIYYYSVDNSGNQEEINSKTIVIDRDGPRIDVKLNNETLSKWDTLMYEVSTSDNVSGVGSHKAYVDEREVGTLTLSLMNYLTGKHSLKIRACDNAGNCSVKEVLFLIYTNYSLTMRDLTWMGSNGMRNPGFLISLGAKLQTANLFSLFRKSEKEIQFLRLARAELWEAYKKKRIDEKYFKLLQDDINYLIERIK